MARIGALYCRANSYSLLEKFCKIKCTSQRMIGINPQESYAFVQDFAGTVAEAGCNTFIAHARNAVLKGLSLKQHREVPPLKYEFAYQLKRDFPHLAIIVNGGIKHLTEIDAHLAQVDGVMIGLAAMLPPGKLFGHQP
jgi:tRNA-dihydrouridine synthase A